MASNNAIVNGFSKDITLLLKRFVKQSSTNFKCFCNEWQRMNFHYVFFGYSCLSEMLQFLEDAFIVVKHALLDATCLLEQIGAVFLMYTMYFKQPTKQYCKFRVTLDEWIKINKFYNEIGIHPQVSLVLWKLLQADAFRFVEAEYEYGFERFMQKGVSKVELADSEDRFKKANPIFESSLHSLRNKTTGLIPALEILQVGYNEMKEHLCQASTTKGILPVTSIASDITNGLLKIKKIFKHPTEIDESDDDNDSSNSDSNTKPTLSKAKLKRKGRRNQSATPATSSSSAKKVISTKYRGTVTDDGEFIQIKRTPAVKSKSQLNLNERQIKTVVKQLHLPFEGESELVLPGASRKRKFKIEKSDQANVTNLSLPSICSTTD